MNALRAGLSVVLFSVAILFATSPSSAQLMIVGNDQKFAWDETNTRQVMPPGKDTVSIVDIGTDPAAPKIVANLPLMNSLIGPPTNLAMTPDERLAIVANSLDWVQDGASWKQVPDNKVFVIDLKMTPPVHAATLEVGRQPSGVAINRLGDLALVANRVDKSISGKAHQPQDRTTRCVRTLEATPPRVIDRVAVGDAPEGLAISPTGEIAVAALLRGTNAPKTAWYYNRNGSIVILSIEGKRVTKIKELEVGGLPEGIVFSPDGKYLYVGNLIDRDVSILRVDGTNVTDTGKRLKLPGQPASMRGRPR